MSEEELKEYFRSLFENGLTLGEIMDMLSDFIDEIMEANGLGDILNSILDLEIDIIMEAFKPILNILAALADVANEYIDNFEGVVIELMASGGALLGGTYGLSFIYSTTLSGDGWKAFKFFGVGGTTPGFSAMVGIGAFFWHGQKDFIWKDWEGLFIDYSGSGGIGIANIGVQLFASGDGKIRGGMLMIGAGIPGISGNLSYYWPHDEEFSWFKFLGAF